MKKIIYSTLFAACILTMGSSCSDYLETDTKSKADAAFVFSTNETAVYWNSPLVTLLCGLTNENEE